MKNPFVKASNKKKYLKIFIYGGPGVGKTWFGLGFPKPAVIDIEGGTDLYADRFEFHVLDTKSFSAVMSALDFLEKEKHDYETLIIDPITNIYDALQDGRLEFKSKNLDKAVSGEEKADFNYRDWGQIKRYYKMLMTRLVNLPMHVIMLARMKDKYEKKANGDMIKLGDTFDGGKGSDYAPDIYGKLIVRGKKRVLLVEKSRAGDWDCGDEIQDLSFDSFKHLISTDEGEVIAHASEEEAIQKDAEFFQSQEKKPERPKSNGNGKGNGGNGKNEGNGNKIPLLSLYNRLLSKGIFTTPVVHYESYCIQKYKTLSMDELSPEEDAEQRKVLTYFANHPQDTKYRDEFESALKATELVSR